MDDNTDFTEVTPEPVEVEAPAKVKKPVKAAKAASSKSETARARVMAKLAAKGK